MDEQLLKDFLATAEANNWNWDVVIPAFPELEGVDLQLLKDYAATAKANNYDYSIVNSKFPELFPKKKDDSEPTSTDQPVVSATEPISSDISVQEPEATTYFPINTDTGEIDTAIERWFGKNEITDFFGDIYRAGAQGQKQAGVVDDALSLMTSGADATDEEVQDFLNAVNEMNNTPMSDEMKDFERVFEEQGGGVWGFIKGIVESPTVIPQLFVSSVSAMANPASAAAAAVGGAAGTAVPIVGTMAGAIGAAGATLETSLSFAEFLQEEVRERGLDFTKENVKEVLNDPDALSRIRRRAAARGIAIGAIDGLTGGIAGKVTGSIAKAGAKTVGRRLASASTGIGVEGVGGSLGEVAGRLAAGQEMDIKEIGFEGIAGTATAPLTVGTAVYKAPKYKINGKVVPADVAVDFVRNATPQEILESQIDVTNDNELSKEFQNRRSDAQIEINFDPRYSAEDRAKLIALQKEKENLNPDVYVGKKRIKKIESEMDAIMDKYEETTVDVTSQEAVDALKQEGVENPTQQQIIDKTDQLIKEKQDAVQEQETRDIPDAQRAEGVQEVETEVREPSVQEETQEVIRPNEINPSEITQMNIDAESKLREEGVDNLFIGATLPTGSIENAIPINVDVVNGIPVAIYANEKTGSIDTVISGFSENNFVGYYRIYENGKPTNKWSSKFENRETGKADIDSKRKDNFKTMISSVQERLPSNHRYTEKTSISTDGLRVWANQIDRGTYQLEYDKNGNLITNRVAINGDAIVNELGINVSQGSFQDITVRTEEEFNKVKEALLPYLQKFGLNENNIHRKGSKVEIDLPVLNPSKTKSVEEKTQLTPEEEAAAIEKDIVDNNLESFANRVVEGGIENFSPEALDFYAENKEVLDQLIQEKQRQVPKTQSKERSLAMRIADGQTEFNDAEIDLFAANQEAIRAEVDAIANTRGIEITSETYKNILESTKSTTAKDVTTEKVNKLRKEFWQNWNKAWREAKADAKGKQKLLFDAIAQNVKDGAISKQQQKALMNKAKNINLDNEAKVQELIDYSEKIFTDAEYADKVAKAGKIRNRIKKAAKNAEANLSRAAKDFSSVDPTRVESIDDYLNAAQNLIEGLSPTKAALTRKGGITVRGAADIDAVNQYSSKELKIAEERKNQRLTQQFEELTGKNADEFSFSEMREMIADEQKENIQAKVEEKQQTIKEAADNAFNQVRESITQTLDDSSLPSKTKDLVSNFMDVNLKTLNARETLKALDALINFNENNQATGGMQAFVDQQKAIEKANEIAKQNIPSRNLNVIGKYWSEQISTLPQLFENIFITQQKARKMSDAMGVTKYQNDTAKAERDARNFTDKYVNKFKKTKPNGKKWNDASNIYERGVYAFMNRTVDGNVDNQQTEFNRRKGLIEKSIEALRQDGQEKKADLYQEVFDKVVGDAKNRSELSVNPINKQSVDFVSNEWAKVYPEVSDVALNVYNRKLDADLNYTPDNFSKLKETDSSINLNEPLFKESNFAYDKESGTLLPTTKPKSLTDRYVNLDFDSQNIYSLQNALTDVYSAGTVQYMNAFINSDSFKKVVPDARAREVLRGRIKTLVDLKRNQAYVSKSQKEILNYVNKVATISTGRVLGGIAQFPKQFFPPLINTFGQAGGLNTMKGFTSLFDKDANAFLDKSGMSIANRGIQSQTALESVNKKLDANLDNTGQKILSALAKPSEFLLKTFLVSGDKAAARSSWIAYYLQGLKKQGIKNTNIDWATHEMNQDAANFAQQQVDRNQNVSDADLQGELFTSKKLGTVIGKKIFFPFATFILNAKNRMVNDGRALFSKTASTQERGQALRSLLALSAEQASFHTMGYFITNTMYKLAENMIDEIEPDEDKRKREKNILKGRLTTVVTDIASPIPPLDYPTIATINKMLEAVQSDEDPFQFFSNDKKTFLEQAGQLGIGLDKAQRLNEMMDIVMNGTYTDSYGREKQISEYGKSKVEAQLLPYFLYSLGLLPTEMGSLSEKVVKMAKKLKDADVEYYPIQ